ITLTFVQASYNLKNIWIKEIGNEKEKKIMIMVIISNITLDIIGLVDLTTNLILQLQSLNYLKHTNLLPLFARTSTFTSEKIEIEI
ncbi:36367_t:CDS:2, partial [Racocetra persica]